MKPDINAQIAEIQHIVESGIEDQHEILTRIRSIRDAIEILENNQKDESPSATNLHQLQMHQLEHQSAFANINLSGQNLEGLDLSGINLQGANLTGANLKGAKLQGADLRGAKGIKKK